jgi:hypothetical protein
MDDFGALRLQGGTEFHDGAKIEAAANMQSLNWYASPSRDPHEVLAILRAAFLHDDEQRKHVSACEESAAALQDDVLCAGHESWRDDVAYAHGVDSMSAEESGLFAMLR